MSRIWFDWNNTTGDNDRGILWDTDVVAKVFGIAGDDRQNLHPAIIQVQGFETTTGSAASMFIKPDPQYLDESDPNPDPSDDGGTPQFLDMADVNPTGDIVRDFLILRAKGDAFRSFDATPLPLEISNSLQFTKAAADTWIFAIDYILLEPGLDWGRERAELMEDITRATLQRSAGGIWNQIGNRYQIDRREY